MKNSKLIKNLKLIIAALILAFLGFVICKYIDSKHEHENVRIQCHGNR
jgi:hypothetical protein